MSPKGPSKYFLGSTCAAILTHEGSHIYYQASDGSIHESSHRTPGRAHVSYTDRVVVTGRHVRTNTPIAATICQKRIYVYYITPENIISGVSTEKGTNKFKPSVDLGFVTAANSGFLYAICPSHDATKRLIRVGFQSGSKSEVVEAEWTEGEGWTKRTVEF